jgi:TonB family protein
VFVTRRLPWRRFFESALYHVAVFLVVWGAAQVWPQRRQVMDRPVFDPADVIYYDASEYLPPLDTGGKHIYLPVKGDPEYAPQPIISVPPEADNRTQTIVTPPEVKLTHDVPVPNIVAWSPTPSAVPLAATARSAAELKLPTLPTTVVAPAPEVGDVSAARALNAPQPAVIAPPPEVAATSSRRLGDINIGPADVVAPAPQLPVGEQRALPMAPTTLGTVAAVPPPPSVEGMGASGGGRIIALGIHPAAAIGPVAPPAGNRRGTFAATPEGKPGATGRPDTVSGGAGNGGGASAGTNGAPPGLFVGAGPKPGDQSAIAGHGHGNGNGGGAQSARTGDATLMASVTPPRVTSVPRRSSEMTGSPAEELARKVFGDRKFYSMTLNMPNLNSAGGSWVIRFAELKVSEDQGELVAPVATQKVDPAYPIELMRQNVQGTVMLYAVIRGDGTVSDVRVLRGVDERLDRYAATALSRWHFLPATKNGDAVTLEAVVMIPFRIRRQGF